VIIRSTVVSVSINLSFIEYFPKFCLYEKNYIRGKRICKRINCCNKSMVPLAGLEPARPCRQQILSLPRLPFHHRGNTNVPNLPHKSNLSWIRCPHVRARRLTIQIPFVQKFGTWYHSDIKNIEYSGRTYTQLLSKSQNIVYLNFKI
jgi:hypothetical protein